MISCVHVGESVKYLQLKRRQISGLRVRGYVHNACIEQLFLFSAEILNICHTETSSTVHHIIIIMPLKLTFCLHSICLLNVFTFCFVLLKHIDYIAKKQQHANA